MIREESTFSLDSEDLLRLTSVLERLRRDAHLRRVLVVDRAGRLLCAAGPEDDLDPASFASLAAADFAASGKLAELLGEQEFSSLFHQGDAGSLYLLDVGGWAILAALFDRRTTLGLVRLAARGSVPELVQLFEAVSERRATAPEARLGSHWAEEAFEEVDRLFME